ncbi:peptidyl-prolyl cis-trans isomerase D-like isoform X4 [Bacillus rossius redtenbacheri]|uniref:peptidyl-prolyl cis-trans isomerase D-like isoform X4 n=1 Tax=Bacillus rossius redtenbacheri TaxID=93214 RepID=UPI002FDEA731
MSTSGNPIVFLDVRIGTEKCGRIVLELFADVAPRTAENFRALCTGEKGAGASGRQLHYKGSVFHKAVLQFIIQGGDITHFDGSGGESIYGATFPDECFTVKHDRPGVLSMANAGPHTNSSQFFITTGAYPHLDNVNVAFGEVRAGLGVVLEVSAQPTEKDRPVLDCVVEDCGQLAPGQDWGVAESDGTADVYPPFPEDWHQDASRPPKVEAVERVVLDIKASGNSYFTAENYVDASRKYKKALRYIDWCHKHAGSEERRLARTKLACLLNLAATKLKALQLDADCAKALYRRGQARIGLNDYEVALSDLRAALALLPSNKDIVAEIGSVKKLISSYLVLEKVRFEKMFK